MMFDSALLASMLGSIIWTVFPNSSSLHALDFERQEPELFSN